MSAKTKTVTGRRRPIASREQILATARELGIRDGWKAVTIRSIATEMGYAHPLLYQHFADKEDVLTHLAGEGLKALEEFLVQRLPTEPLDAILLMAEHYWTFMLQNKQMYRLMNGMDGIAIDNDATRNAAQRLCTQIGKVIQRYAGKRLRKREVDALTDEIWALLHGMAILHLDRGAQFDLVRVRKATRRLMTGDS